MIHKILPVIAVSAFAQVVMQVNTASSCSRHRKRRRGLEPSVAVAGSSPPKMIGPGNHVPGQSPAGKEASISLGGDGRDSYLRGAPAPAPLASPDPRLPLFNLSLLGQRMESIRRFLSDAIDRHVPIDPDQLQLVSSQIASAARETILNGASLLASSQIVNPSLGTSHFSCIQQLLPSSSNAAGAVDPTPKYPATPRFPETKSLDPLSTHLRDDSDPPVEDGEDCHIVEIDTVELLAEHVHFCDICGKGFKRDANLRMHMRAHGDKFKTLEALSKPDRDVRPSDGGEATTGRKIRFSCPYHGCNRNRAHKKFRPLKSVACVKNHFKRSHCPKTYSCYRCNKKSFSVVADLKSHLKYCGEIRWRCSCGTSFSRKDKLFGHIALFEGHMPAVEVGAEEEAKKKDVILEEDEEEDEGTQGAQQDGKGFDPEFFKGLVEDFDDMERGYWRVD